MSNFHPHEVVGRDSETQLQVGENLNAMFGLKLTNMSIFHPFEVVGRGSETQLGENLSKIT